MFSKRLISLVPKAKFYIAIDVVFQWLALLANIALFILIGLILQELVQGSLAEDGIAALLCVAALALVIRFVCQILARRMGQKAALEAKTTIRQKVYGKLIELGPTYKESIATSEALQISVEGVEHLESYFGLYLPQLFYSAVAPLTLFACLAPLSLPTALVLLICVPFIPASIMAVQKIAKRVMGKYWGTYTDLGAMFLEGIQGLTTLKVFKADEKRHTELNEEAQTFRRATMRLLVMQLNSITIMDFFAFGGAALGIIIALTQFAAGNATFAAVFSIVFLSAEFFLPLRALGSFFHTAMSGMSAADRMFALLDTHVPESGTRSVDPNRADIEFTGVGYSYDGDRTVLSEVDLKIKPGSFIGITGESGSGKSTLAGILAGRLGKYEGTVRIGGVDLGDISRVSLRETITYVPFASYLFEGTIRTNLQLAKPQATDAEMMEALRRCRLDAFVRAQGGLDAKVSPEGSNLSGGQRQRLAMARALLHDTPVYVLDEATSNIDAESEAAMIELVHEMAAEKTVIMITHRLLALKDADAIYVLADGRVVESGTHDGLAVSDGAYAHLWAEQSKLEEFAKGESAGEQACSAADASGDACVVGDTDAADGASAVGATVGSDATRQDDANATEQCASRRSHISVMMELVKLTRPLLSVMVLAITLGVLGFAAAIFLTVFAVYGLVGLTGSFAGIGWVAACVAVAICGIVRGPLRYGEQLCNHYLAFKILALVRGRLFTAMRKLAPAKLEGRNKGDLVSTVTSDVELLEVFYAHTISPALIALIVSVGMVVFIAFQSVVLAGIAALAYVVVGIILPWVSSKVSGSLGRRMRDNIGAMNAFVLDSLRGLPEILQFGRARMRQRELEESMARLAEAEDPLKVRSAVLSAVTGLVVMVFDLVMLVVALGLVASGQLAIAPALLSIAALMSSFGPVIAVAALGVDLQQTLAAGERVLEILDEKPCVNEVVDGVDIDGISGGSSDQLDIVDNAMDAPDRTSVAALRRVDFSYGDEPVLDEVSLQIEPGSVVQIAGRSGAGKSTLLKLLMRFWDADNGVVEVAGRDIRRINTASLRDLEGFMSQETFLFDGTIRENLLIARPDASEEELMVALEKASLADLVKRLPQGLDTPLGDLGDSLSGGERQRMGLARVFLHDAPFVLLDEPTSNLDALNEAVVLRSIAHNREGKTVVLVSHRPSASAIADTVYSVERSERAS